MAKSARYLQLEKRISEIENHFFPTINLTGNYTDEEIDFTRAYCVLSHAEIEAYLEDALLEILKNNFIEWKKDISKVTPMILNLICSAQNKTSHNDPPETLAQLGYNTLEAYAKKNNGIKRHNVIGLFSPIGYDLDQTLINDLDNFGSTRGDIVHQSFKTQSLLDPLTEQRNLTNIIIGLLNFDEDFYKLLAPGSNIIKVKSQNNLLQRFLIKIGLKLLSSAS